MTSTYLATGIGSVIGLTMSIVAYNTIPVYHSMAVWSWGLVGINLEAIFS